MTVPSPSAVSLSDADLYRLVRNQVEFEASLAAQRLSWFVASQAFLFSAYAITLNAPHEPAMREYAEQQQLMFRMIPVVAIATCALIYLALLGALFAQTHLRHYLGRAIGAERLGAFPPIQGARSTHLLGLAAPLGLPLVFVAAWIFLLTRGMG